MSTHTAIHRWSAVVAVASSLVLPGCDPGPGRPRAEPGPMPFTNPERPVERYRVARGSLNVRQDATVWHDGRGIIEPRDRIANLSLAIPEELIERLKTTRSVPNMNGVGVFDQPMYDAQETIVSLDPDIMIMTIRERPQGSYENLFGYDLFIEDMRRNKLYRNGRELIATQGNVKGEAQLIIFAGRVLPWSSEMYVIATDARIESGRLKFVDNSTTIPAVRHRIVLTRDGNDVVAHSKPMSHE